MGETDISQVFRAYRKNDLNKERPLVVKVIKIEEDKYWEKCIERELEINKILTQKDPRYFIKFYKSFRKEDKIYFIMEECQEGDLLKFIRKKKWHPLPVRQKLDIMIHFTRGLIKLHELDILHRDLKLENIMMK